MQFQPGAGKQQLRSGLSLNALWFEVHLYLFIYLLESICANGCDRYPPVVVLSAPFLSIFFKIIIK
jgi:hypothetical protein